ncbi:MAG: hypothetical protein E6639_26420, partial [Klebsiella pneumoniae]|nr:hypothetical protein [Klebsiella pneumoniae]MDU7860504.1 hypothetical protein [Klebsiella pneumoniae]
RLFAGKKSAQIREILISESAWEEMTCLFAPSLTSTARPIVDKIASTFASASRPIPLLLTLYYGDSERKQSVSPGLTRPACGYL